MSLDIFQDDQASALSDAATRIAPDLPATFGDTFDAAVTNGIEWHNSLASQFAKEHALNDYIQNVRDMTGETLPNPGYLIGGASLDEFNAKQQALNEKYPINLQPLTPEDIEGMTARRMARAHDRSAAMNSRERTWGGTAGNVFGGLVASPTDPVMLATLPLGGMGELGIIGRSLEFGALNAGTEAAVDLAQYRAHERAVPGSSKEIPGEILSAGLFGLGLGGVFGTLGKFLRAGERPLPTSVRDAVNTGASEAQLDATNIFPTAEGEIAGRDATTQAVTQAAKGEAVTAGRDFDPAHVEAFAQEAVPGTLPSFTTAKGSTYEVHPDGTTVRNKAARPDVGHEGDSGIKTQSDKTIYVAPEVASELSGAGLQGLDPKGFRVAIKDGKAYGLTWNEKADGWGASPGGRDIPFSTDPEVGKSPVELWKPADDVPGYEAYRGQHAGNAITEVRPGRAPDAEALARAGDQALRPITFDEMPDVERFATMPIAGEDTAGYWDRYLEGATAEERAAVGATDATERPNAPSGETLASDSLKPGNDVSGRIIPADLSPADVSKLAGEPATYDAVQKALIDYRVANPDAEFSVQVRQADGSYLLTTRKLADVIDEIDQQHNLAQELMTCAVGATAA